MSDLWFNCQYFFVCQKFTMITTTTMGTIARRHYKKDTRFLLDLYTLTYDENEDLESLDEIVSLIFTYSISYFFKSNFFL